MREAIALYSAKSAEMARAGSSGAAELWKDLKLRLNNTQKQFSLASTSSAQALSEMEKAGRSAASKYESKTKPPAKAKARKTGASNGMKVPTAKPAKP